ncbi:MAG TPA: hypothetical protein VMB71_06965 [Acetobacteraceae bacterium]|nr:hypothetical protein [Acetobacteraceae bacterium]
MITGKKASCLKRGSKGITLSLSALKKGSRAHVVPMDSLIATRFDGDSPPKEVKSQASSSFLKKRTKELSSVAGGTDAANVVRLLRAEVKSFLFLLFKIKILPCFARVSTSTRVGIRANNRNINQNLLTFFSSEKEDSFLFRNIHLHV